MVHSVPSNDEPQKPHPLVDWGTPARPGDTARETTPPGPAPGGPRRAWLLAGLAVVAAALVAALLLTRTGGSSTPVGTLVVATPVRPPSTPARPQSGGPNVVFVAAADGACQRLNDSVTSEAAPLTQAQLTTEVGVDAGLQRTAVAQFARVTAPPSAAVAWAAYRREAGREAVLLSQLAIALRGHSAAVHATEQRLSEASINAEVLARGLGLEACTVDPTPTRYVPRNARERFITSLDRICASARPAVYSAVLDIRASESALKHHTIAPVFAVNGIIAATRRSAVAYGQVATDLAGLRRPPAFAPVAALRRFTADTAQLGVLSGYLAAAMDARQIALLHSIARQLGAVQVRTERDGAPLHALACANGL
jgi:hypothetical protein